jgi:hypothetical protein
MLKIARRDDDDNAITYDPLSVRITDLTQHFTTQIDLHEFHNWAMAGRKLMKSGMDVMP